MGLAQVSAPWRSPSFPALPEARSGANAPEIKPESGRAARGSFTPAPLNCRIAFDLRSGLRPASVSVGLNRGMVQRAPRKKTKGFRRGH